MKRHGRVFLATFIPSAALVAALVVEQRSLPALLVGIVGLLAYWALSAKQDGNGELADASYFFGFLLTLTFLATGLFTLGTAMQQPGANLVLSFLEELGAGLMLTILGLLIRQVRALSLAGRAAGDSSNALTDAQRQLADAMRALVAALANRPGEVAARELQDTRGRARDATDRLERNVVQAGERIERAMTSLEEAATSVTTALVRASSGLGDSLTQSTERIQLELSAALALLAAQRRKIDSSLAAYTSVDEDFRNGVAALGEAGATFSALAVRVKHDIEAMPNPAERLDRLRSHLDEVSAALARLERSTGTAAASIEHGGADLGAALHRELRQMNQILEQYTTLLERNVGAYSPR